MADLKEVLQKQGLLLRSIYRTILKELGIGGVVPVSYSLAGTQSIGPSWRPSRTFFPGSPDEAFFSIDEYGRSR